MKDVQCNANNAKQNRQVLACLQTNCCRLVYTLTAVGRVSADPMRKFDCLPKFGSPKNSKSKVESALSAKYIL